MKLKIENLGQHPLKIMLRTGPDNSNDNDPTNNGIEDVVVEVGKTFILEEGVQLGSIRELTPTPETTVLQFMYTGS